MVDIELKDHSGLEMVVVLVVVEILQVQIRINVAVAIKVGNGFCKHLCTRNNTFEGESPFGVWTYLVLSLFHQYHLSVL